MTSDEPKGWCPGVHRPMPVEDGLLARLRPHLGSLSRAQILGLAELALTYGNGLMEVTRRANLQIRGLARQSYPAFLSGVDRLGLLDPDDHAEKRRAIQVTPFWSPGDATETLANGLVARLDDLPELPEKFGHVIDLGTRPVLGDVSGDVRLERSEHGFIVRADGSALGRPVTTETALDTLLELCRWFSDQWTFDTRRMARVTAIQTLPDAWMSTAPLAPAEAPGSGRHQLGTLTQIQVTPFEAKALISMVDETDVQEIRLTPWRKLLFVEPATEDVGLPVPEAS
ncbi:MAG: cobalamin biosynthesis protein CobG [Pseudomonadota bacterium]